MPAATTVFDHAKFRELRLASGLSPTEFAASVGCSGTWLWRLEAGRSKPNATLLVALAAAVGVQPGELLAVEDPPAPTAALSA